MIRIALGISALAAGTAFTVAVPSGPAAAQDRAGEIIVYGNDPCPRSTDDEVVVCSRRPERERYRIAENLRPSGTRQQRQAWGAQAQTLNSVGNVGINSCSSVGPGGHTGCLQQMIDQARAEAAEETAANRPPE